MKTLVLGAALIAAAVLILPSIAELGMAQDQTDPYGDAIFSAGDQEGGLEGFLRILTQDASASSATSVSIDGGSVSSGMAVSGTPVSSAEVLEETGTETGATPEGLPNTGGGGMAE